MSQRNLTLGFIGDVMLGRRVNEAIAHSRPEAFWGDALPLLRAADAVVANLESPITAQRRKWQRSRKAFRFRADPAATAVLAAANIRCVCLANNHILDYEEAGLFDTIEHLAAAGIAHCGAGQGSAEALQPARFEAAGRTVGCLAVTDTMPEFAAGPDRSGTNHLRLDDSHATLGLVGLQVDALRRAGAEIVVLTTHWGPNLRPWPSARHRRFAHAVAGLGVDLLHGHSAHLCHGVEVRDGRIILYDTGDFLDDYWVFPFIRTDRSCLFLVEFGERRVERLRLVPVTLEPTRVRLARGGEFEAICRAMRRRCRPFGVEFEATAEGLALDLVATPPARGAGRSAAVARAARGSPGLLASPIPGPCP